MGQVEPGEVPEWFGVRFAEHAMALFRYENGVFGTLESGGDRDMGTGVRVLCEDGLLEVVWGGQFKRAVVFSDSSWQPPEIGEAAGLEPTADALITSMETGEESELDVAKSLRSNEVVFALYESSRRRDCIHLPIETRENPYVAMLEAGDITPKVDAHEGY
jgi:predicted dehydrogenase